MYKYAAQVTALRGRAAAMQLESLIPGPLLDVVGGKGPALEACKPGAKNCWSAGRALALAVAVQVCGHCSNMFRLLPGQVWLEKFGCISVL